MEIKEAAEKAKCRRVWTNYATWHYIRKFLGESEMLDLQRINLFFYNIAVSRVQLLFNLPHDYYYFVEANCPLRKNHIFKVDLKTNTVSYKVHDNMVFEYSDCAVSLNGSLYCLANHLLNWGSSDFWRISNIDSPQPTVTKLDNPVLNGTYCAMAGFKNYLFCTGGRVYDEDYEFDEKITTTV